MTIDAHDAWWPPTFSPSRLARTWLAWWIIHVLSHSTLRSTAAKHRAASGAGAPAGAAGSGGDEGEAVIALSPVAMRAPGP